MSISGDLLLLSCVFRIFFQMQSVHFQILDTNTNFKTDAPWSDTYKVVYQSDGQINRPVSYTFTIGDENWKFEVTPKKWMEKCHITDNHRRNFFLYNKPSHVSSYQSMVSSKRT